jgi:hypothetical protein
VAHDTPDREASTAFASFGLATIDQCDPFHRSSQGRRLWPVLNVPTAKQLAAPEHETPDNKLARAPEGLGLDTTDQ